MDDPLHLFDAPRDTRIDMPPDDQIKFIDEDADERLANGTSLSPTIMAQKLG